MVSTLSEQGAEAILGQASDATIFGDMDGTIRLWSGAAEAIFGYSSAEAVGQRLELIIPERFRSSHWIGYERAMAAKDTKYKSQLLLTRSQHKDGTAIYVEMALAILHDEEGNALGALATLRDVTQRRADERAAQERVEELEQRLAAKGGDSQTA